MMNECYIVGGGPSLKNFDWSLLNGKFVIAINRAYETLPNANIVYFTDTPWWEEHKERLLKHNGQLIKGSLPNRMIKHPKVKEYILTGETGFDKTKGCLKHGRNSTHAAINLAVAHLGFKTVYLLGIDMKFEGDKTHWHDGHKRIDPPRAFGKMIKNFKIMKKYIQNMDVEIINVNTPEQTNLKCFPIKSQEEVFNC